MAKFLAKKKCEGAPGMTGEAERGKYLQGYDTATCWYY